MPVRVEIARVPRRQLQAVAKGESRLQRIRELPPVEAAQGRRTVRVVPFDGQRRKRIEKRPDEGGGRVVEPDEHLGVGDDRDARVSGDAPEIRRRRRNPVEVVDKHDGVQQESHRTEPTEPTSGPGRSHSPRRACW